MKKAISILILSTAFITGTVTIAQAATLSVPQSNTTQTVTDNKTIRTEILQVLQAVRDNHQEILGLRASVKEAQQKAKEHLQALRSNKENLSADQIQSIKAALNNIKQDRQALKGTQGDIANVLPDLRAARKDKNVDQVKADVNNIIDVQNTRISELNKIIDDLNQAAAL